MAVEDIHKVFDDGHQRIEVLRGITLGVAPGCVLALEGPSGSGKTTLLSIMGCLLSPSSGRVLVDDIEVGRDPERQRQARRQRIGFVFQQFNLFPALTAHENVEYSLNVRGVAGAEASRLARTALERVELTDKLHALPRDLSGGQKQRVAIARAVAARPAVLLADEPTANLDSTTGMAILDQFRELAREDGCALVVVTHDPKVRRIADRVVGIRDGRLVV